MSGSLRPYGLQPTRLLCPWDFPGKNTGVGGHFLLQDGVGSDSKTGGVFLKKVKEAKTIEAGSFPE